MPYRSPVERPVESAPRSRPPVRDAVLVGAALAMVASATLRTREEGPAAVRGDDDRPGALVEHAELLGTDGGDVCALTRMRDGRRQIVCAEGREESRGEVVRRVSVTWESPALVQLLPVRTGDGAAALGVLGLREAGEVVLFAPGRARAEPVSVAPPSPPGRIHAMLGVSREPLGPHGSEPEALALIVRAADGAHWSLALPDDLNREGAPARWHRAQVRCGTRPFTLRQTTSLPYGYGSIWEDPPDGVCALETFGGPVVVSAPHAAAVATLLGWDKGLTLSGGTIRAYRPPFFGAADRAWRPVTVEGAPRFVVALASSVGRACIADARRSWRCTRSLRARAMPDVGEGPVSFEAEPLLEGAEEVALAYRLGCARWPGGAVRCAGADLRAGSYVRRGPTALVGLGRVSALVADSDGYCALQGGDVRCWRTSLPDEYWQPLMTPRAFPANVTFLASPTLVARGAEVWRAWHWDGCGGSVCAFEQLPDDRADATPIVALRGGWDQVCARHASGREVCWDFRPDRREPDWSPPRRARARERRWLDGVEPEALDGWREPEDRCALLPGGAVACAPRYHVGAMRDARVRVAGLEGIRVLPRASGNDPRCALRGDGQVMCWGRTLNGLLTQDEEARAPELVPLRRAE